MLSTKHFTGLFFIGIMVMSGVAPVLADTFGVSNTVVSPLVVQFGDFVEEMAAIAELKSNFLRAHIVDFSAYDKIVSFKGPIIYIGHGSDLGINYQSKLVAWETIEVMVKASISNSHYFLGCESSKIVELSSTTGKNVVGFREKIDAVLGALIIIYHVNLAIGESINILDLAAKFERRIEEIENGETELLLVDTESGYRLAVKREDRSSTKWGITYYKERIFWINAENRICWTYFTVSAIKATIVAILAYFSILGPVALAISLVFAAHATTITATTFGRWRSDCMGGFGAAILPYPSTNFWYEIDAGEFFIPTTIPNIGALILYYALSAIPTAWVPVPIP